MFTRQHYEMIAEILGEIINYGDREHMKNRFSNMFKEDNPRFSPMKFKAAVNTRSRNLSPYREDVL